jgi:hypothetical protein
MKEFTKGESVRIVFDDGRIGHGVIVEVLKNGLCRVGFQDGQVFDYSKYRFLEYEDLCLPGPWQ